ALQPASRINTNTVRSKPNISSCLSVRPLFHCFQRIGEALFFAVVACTVPEMRPSYSGRNVFADQPAGSVFALDVVEYDVLRDDDVALHADHLSDVGDAARAVAQARRLDDDVDRTDDDLAHGALGQRIAAHGDHRLYSVQAFSRAVGVDRAHRAVMAGVHGLQEIEHFRSAHLADDDALRAHAQAVLDQVAHGHLALAFQVGRARFQTHHMRLLQLQFGRVLAGDHALVTVDIVAQAVEQRRLARARAARDDDVAAHAADDLQHLRAFRRDRAETHQLVEGELVLLELADGKRGAVDGQRRSDDVDAAAVRKARVADRARFVDAAADLADDALADIEKLLVVAEADAGLLDLAVHLDEDLLGAVDHDVGDVVARQQRLQRAVAQNV